MAAAFLGAACGRNSFVVPATDRAAAIRSGPALPVGEVWILEQSGPSPTDTTIQFPAASGRTVMMRHGAPDNAVYAIVDFPPGSVTPVAGDSARVTIAPTPGRFGVAIETPGALGPGVQVTFSYGTHFQAPSDATVRYPSPIRFEQSMGAAKLDSAGAIQFVPTARPAADMMRFAVSSKGTFVLAAPR